MRIVLLLVISGNYCFVLPHCYSFRQTRAKEKDDRTEKEASSLSDTLSALAHGVCMSL